jgi:hypothetical protein
MPQNELDRANNEIQKFLTATDWTQKNLLMYQFNTINSTSDPLLQSILNAPRNQDNFTYSTFYNAGPGNAITIATDGTLRIKNSNSGYTTAETNGNIQEEFFESMINATIDDANYLLTANISNAPYTDLAQNLIGISYIFKPGTQYSQP